MLDCPFTTSIESTTATLPLHEWLTDGLAAAANNAVLEGDDATTDAVTAAVRLSNTCQISDKVPRVTGTQQVVKKAGRRDELAYQIHNKTMELRTDIETALTQNTAEVTGNATTARQLGGFPTWITTNTSLGVGGVVGGLGNTAAINGTQRAISETLLQDVLQLIWTNGGKPDCLMVGAFNKRKVSEFTGNATRVKTAEDRTLQAAIDLYDTDWGELQIIPNRFQPPRTAFIMQKDMLAIAWLRSVMMQNLAKTGDSERRQVICEYTLEVRNELAHGIIFDLNTA